MKLLRTLRRSTMAATAVEFALLAPVFITMMFGIVEGGRLFWTRQVLNNVAYSTVRCISINSSCNTTTLAKNFAIAKARGYGITLTTSSITLTPDPINSTGTTCKTYSNSNKVDVTANFNSALKGFVPLPTSLTATACFPVMT